MSVKLRRALNASDYQIADTSEIYSPGYVVFKSLVEANLKEMIRIAGDVGSLRPHCKTHKMPAITRIQLDVGIAKHKCATIAEAEMLCDAGVDDILIAYQLVGPNIDRLVRLIDKYPTRKFATIVDHPSVLSQLSSKLIAKDHSVHVLIDVDPGMGRTGIEPNDAAAQLYEMICSTPNILPDGIHWYDGHQRQTDLTERRLAIETAWKTLIQLRDRLRIDGFPIPKLVVAGTGSFPVLAEMGEPNLELTPGTVTLYDVGYFEQFPDLDFQPAAGVLTRVISCNRDDHITLDCGHKSISPDQPAGGRVYFPELPDAVEAGHTEEHLVLQTDRAKDFSPGDHLVALPRHVCPTSALHKEAYVIENGELVDRWPIVGRDRVLGI